jgi:2-keto-4-pentenoate hydratase/2-oxohepta-3-ene-1,7-dioic acid hydratase in catechol pathway
VRVARIATTDRVGYAIDDGQEWVFVDDPFADSPQPNGQAISYGDAILLAPVEPRVILGMAHNGGPSDRAAEPQAFHKSARTAAGPGDTIGFDPSLGRTLIEGELAIVIGRNAYKLTNENALDAVLGYTVANDVSAADQSPLDSFWTQTKNGPNFSPIGPWIETDFDPFDAIIRVRVNGEQVAEASTAQLARNVIEVLVYVTRHVTLGPGDVIMTGCPGTMYAIQSGDSFDVEIVGLGTLSNRAE